MVRTAEAKAVGCFNDDYFMYWEDVAISSKLRRRGLRIVWLPWVRVEHLGGQSSGGGRSPLRKFLMACNAVRYLKAHGSVNVPRMLILCRPWLIYWASSIAQNLMVRHWFLSSKEIESQKFTHSYIPNRCIPTLPLNPATLYAAIK